MKSGLGLRPDRGSPFQSWTETLGSDRGQHSSPARDSACPETEREHDVEGLHHSAYGGVGRPRGADFITAHMAVLAGADFFTVEVLTWRGLITYYVLFFLHVETRRVSLAGITRHPTEEWMTQMVATRLTRHPGIYANIGSCCTTTIRSSARSSGRRWQQEV